MPYLRSKSLGLAALLAVCLVYLGSFLPAFPLESSVLSLLPPALSEQAPAELNEAFVRRLDAQAVFLVTAPGEEGAQAAAFVADRLEANPAVAQVTGRLSPEQQSAYGRFFMSHKEALLTSEVRDRLRSGAASSYVLSQLYTGFAGVSAGELRLDPLLLTRQLQLSLHQATGSAIALCGEFLCVTGKAAEQADDKQSAGQGQATYYFLPVTLRPEATDLTGARELTDFTDNLRAELKEKFPKARLYQRGSLYFTAAAAQQAEHDITYLGSVTMALVLLLLVVAFRSLRPLLGVLLSVAVGGIMGLAAVLLCFGSVHVFTLLTGLSVVGLCCDYTLYFFTLWQQGQDSPRSALHKVQGALCGAFVTTAVAYLLMLCAPFPGVRQMAVFCVCALLGALLCVLCWQEYLLPRRRSVQAEAGASGHSTGGGFSAERIFGLRALLQLYQGRRRFLIPVVLALFSVWGLTHLSSDDDVRKLGALPPELLSQDKFIAEVTGQSMEQKWLLLWSEDAEPLLQHNDALKALLPELKEQGVLGSWQALPLNSARTQTEDLKLVAQARAQTEQVLQGAGLIQVQAQEQGQGHTENTAPAVLTLPEFLSSPLAQGFGLSVVHTGRLWGLMVPVSDLKDKEALTDAISGIGQVLLIDRRADFEKMFGSFRVLVGWLLAAALGLIALGFMLRNGLRRGLVCALPSVLSVGCALAVPLSLGLSLNFFNILALIMVLGVGINYSLFCSNSLSSERSTLSAVTLAMLTTQCSLGMLALSSVPAVSAFGLSLASGVLCAYLLAPLCTGQNSQEKQA